MRMDLSDSSSHSWPARQLRIPPHTVRLEVVRDCEVAISPEPGSPTLTKEFVEAAMVAASDLVQGPTLLRTPALTVDEARPFLESGFSIRSQLALLIHEHRWVTRGEGRNSGGTRGEAAVDPNPLTGRLRRTLLPSVPFTFTTLLGTPAPNAPRQHVDIRAFVSADLPRVLAIDQSAFPVSWGMDEHDFRIARSATPYEHTSVAVIDDTVVGFAITGRASRRGYLQRLAVDPQAQGHGVGALLVNDCLRWCRRHGVRRVVVNTQQDNHRALALYRRHGFKESPLQLLLLERRPALEPGST